MNTAQHSTTGWTRGWSELDCHQLSSGLPGIDEVKPLLPDGNGAGPGGSAAVDYGLFSQRGPAPAFGGRGRLRSHVFTTGPDVTGCCHTHLRGLHHYHLTSDHHCNGNQHYCTPSYLLQCMCGPMEGTTACGRGVIVCSMASDFVL